MKNTFTTLIGSMKKKKIPTKIFLFSLFGSFEWLHPQENSIEMTGALYMRTFSSLFGNLSCALYNFSPAPWINGFMDSNLYWVSTLNANRQTNIRTDLLTHPWPIISIFPIKN